ncbi:pyridoxal 5'-phosphate synthase [Marinicrinis lubricantis]|uniref:Pyridoxal 5'-phosphate synthase n=1 Tax=Marinicrinis lubricantis TaxID=2086470 RepID=A0ABW1IVS2_9BACL
MIDPKQILRSLETLSGPFPPFDINLLPAAPGELFMEWLNLAIEHEVKEPHAMTLSTMDADGYPDARVLILKNVVDDTFYFASSAESRKGQQLKRNPKAALTFYWPTLGRQIRLRGTVEDMGDAASAADFQERSAEARAIALAGNQSRELASEEELKYSLAAQEQRIRRKPDITTPNWRLYALKAREAEFWQGDTRRKHTRIQYYWSEEQWKHRRLWT